MRNLCRACSEGRPHAHTGAEAEGFGAFEAECSFGVAARSTAEAEALLFQWSAEDTGHGTRVALGVSPGYWRS